MMIYSSVEDNWMRVVIINSIAQNYFRMTADTDFRQRMTSKGKFFPFDLDAYTNMQKESCLVGMIIAWSVITLEALVNYALAETINNQAAAIMAIEYPSNLTEKLKLGRSAKSELAKKMIILNNGKSIDNNLIDIADRLADFRNRIIHDKPYKLLDHGEGDVEIIHYQLRGNSDGMIVSYDQLNDIFKDCDTISNFIEQTSKLDIMKSNNYIFSLLLSGKLFL